MSDLPTELESLKRENARLRKLLKLTAAEAAPTAGTQTAWFDKAPGSVDARSSSQVKVEFYAALFGARRDVYAVRWENARTGKSGWMPAVEGGWTARSSSTSATTSRQQRSRPPSAPSPRATGSGSPPRHTGATASTT